MFDWFLTPWKNRSKSKALTSNQRSVSASASDGLTLLTFLDIAYVSNRMDSCMESTLNRCMKGLCMVLVLRYLQYGDM